MTELFFKVSQDAANALTWGELETLMTGDLVHSRAVIARFMVDENDAPIEYAEAFARLGKLKINEIKSAVEAFSTALKDTAVSPTSASK